MSRANDLAFPAEGTLERGLTIREHFAAMAMQGLLANLADIRKEGFKDHHISEFAVIQADALLAELAKPIEQPLDENGFPAVSAYRERVARSVVSAASGRAFTSDEDVPVQISANELRQLVLIALEVTTP